MVEKEIIMAAIEDTEFEVLKADIEFYFARLILSFTLHGW
jgi:hypothetical protein